MNNGGDAAEQVVRLSLEGFEVAARFDLFNNKDYNLVSNPIEEPILSIGIYIKYIK